MIKLPVTYDYTLARFFDPDGVQVKGQGVADALNAQQWIPVEERLPDKTGEYIITRRGGFTLTAWYDREDFYWLNFAGIQVDDVIAWRPMPEPYKQEGE